MNQEDPCCPFLNAPHVHCDRYVRLDRLRLAFDYCFAAYRVCPEYLRLAAEADEAVEVTQAREAFSRVLVQVRTGNEMVRSGIEAPAVHT
jgi:hypothetical protein